MIDRAAAKRAAENHMNELAADVRVVAFDDTAIERSYGWFFEFGSAEPGAGLRGAGPVLVLRENGGIVEFSSAYDPETAAEAYGKDPTKFPVASA